MERYIGKMLDNRYEILEVIGTGGMAVVFKAKCHRLNRLVAIKMLKRDLSDDAEFRRRFHDESQAVAMLSHPNIVAVYDVSRGGDMDYIVMELIDGITLKQYMARRGKLNWPEALHFITQIMRGLGHAHSRGIIHRDIKPQNIMVLRDGTVKVMDFGIACLSNGSNPSNEAIGSVHYISPEQAKGEYTDNRSDIYSAGVVLYEMLTSRLPFEGDSPMAVAIQHFSAVPLSPRELNPDIPEALEQICMKAMTPDRNRRYISADEMLSDLEAFRKDPTVSFDYSAEDLRRERDREDEPTQNIPNVGAARPRPVRYAPPPPEDDDEEDERRGGGWWKALLLIVLVAAVGYFGVTRLYQGIMDSFAQPEIPEYTVPNVVGRTVEEAMALEEIEGVFEIVESGVHEYSAQYPAGQIIKQEPEADRIKKTASTELIPITVTVSMGSRSEAMPDLVGQEGRGARLILEQTKGLSELKLVITEGEEEYNDDVPAGYVARTDPAVGTELSEGDQVVLYLSLGPEIKYSTMVSCLGQDMEEVQRLMEELHLKAEFVKEESAKPAGQVIRQSVEPNTEVEEGTTITFTYSDGEKLISKTVGFNVPFSPEDVHVEILLDEAVAYEKDLPGDYGRLEAVIQAKPGEHRMRILADGQQWSDEMVTFSE